MAGVEEGPWGGGEGGGGGGLFPFTMLSDPALNRYTCKQHFPKKKNFCRFSCANMVVNKKIVTNSRFYLFQPDFQDTLLI